MERYSITQAKARWEELVSHAEKGERFILTRWGKDVCMMAPYSPPGNTEQILTT